jgi:hypothetical protein
MSVCLVSLYQIDGYALCARKQILQFSTDHNTDIKNLKAQKENLESQITREREREGEMLASKLVQSRRLGQATRS